MHTTNEITGDEQLYIPAPGNLPELTGASDATLERVLGRFAPKLTDALTFDTFMALGSVGQAARLKRGPVSFADGTRAVLGRVPNGLRCIILEDGERNIVRWWYI